MVPGNALFHGAFVRPESTHRRNIPGSLPLSITGEGGSAAVTAAVDKISPKHFNQKELSAFRMTYLLLSSASLQPTPPEDLPLPPPGEVFLLSELSQFIRVAANSGSSSSSSSKSNVPPVKR